MNTLTYLLGALMVICALSCAIVWLGDNTITRETPDAATKPIIHDMCETCYRRPARTTITNTDMQHVHVCHGCLDEGYVRGWWATEEHEWTA